MNKSHPQTITETGDDLSHLFLSYLADAAQQTLSAFQRIIVLPAWIQIGIIVSALQNYLDIMFTRKHNALF